MKEKCIAQIRMKEGEETEATLFAFCGTVNLRVGTCENWKGSLISV